MPRELITSTLSSLAAALLLVVCSSTASATPIQWFDGFGANGHFYEIIGQSNVFGFSDGYGLTIRPGGPGGVGPTWAAARTEAMAGGSPTKSIPGYQASLVTITSQRELDFLMTASGPANHGIIGALLVSSGTAEGVFIGLSETALTNTFEWEPVTIGLGTTPVQEPFAFANWDTSQPTIGAESVVAMQVTGLWQNQLDSFNSHGYIVEWSPIPEPGSMVLCGLGALALAGFGWRRRRNRTQAAV